MELRSLALRAISKKFERKKCQGTRKENRNSLLSLYYVSRLTRSSNDASKICSLLHAMQKLDQKFMKRGWMVHVTRVGRVLYHVNLTIGDIP